MEKIDTSQFSNDEKRALMVAHLYETIRREKQKFYKCFPEDLVDPRTHPSFKSCITVASWLESEGAKVTYKKLDWQCFIKFVFDRLAPTIPHVGQLKNQKLFGDYLKSAPDRRPVDLLSNDKLEALYRKILNPELVKEVGLMEKLGLRNLGMLDPIKWDDEEHGSGN